MENKHLIIKLFFYCFSLEEVRKFKLQNNINNNLNQFNDYNQFINFAQFNDFNNNIVDIIDCFDYDRKINVMSGQNAKYCDYCRQTCNASMCTTLTTGPRILILLLNREKGNQFDVKINYTEYLDLNNYIQFNVGCKYQLIGVISHIMENGKDENFITYCRDPLSNKWYKYNNALISSVMDFQNEVINYSIPYLLFYQML